MSQISKKGATMNVFTVPQHQKAIIYVLQSDGVTQQLNNDLNKWLNFWL